MALPTKQANKPALRYQRWFAAMRNDPVRWAQRMAAQQRRRSHPNINARERQQERARWASLPRDHPRRTRKPQRHPDSVKAKSKRDLERLPDSIVANRYLHLPVQACPKDLIDFKREHIRLTRKLKTSIKTL